MNATLSQTFHGKNLSLLVWLTTALTLAAANAAGFPGRIPDAYAQPATLVTVANGRHLNLRCAGHGEPTIVLEAGSHADSSTWFRLQPLLAQSRRVCAYDRAGYGFSDEGPMPRNLDADVVDLHGLIIKAPLTTPVVLVGHSLGSNIVRHYADKYPRDVVGLVLIDPPQQDTVAFAPAWMKAETATSKQRFVFIHQCEKGAEKGLLASPPENLKLCISRANPLANAKVNAATVAYKLKPAFWRTLLSELHDNDVVFAQPVSAHETHGSTPLVVLTADNTYADAPTELRKKLEAARDVTQTRIVATSTNGKRIFVKNTSHDIQIDQPQAVANAVTALVAELEASKKPKS